MTRRMSRNLCLTAALATVMPAAAAAQGTPPPSIRQEVFVTATVSPLTLERVGQSTVTLSREDLVRLGVTWVADALRLAPGVDVRARGPRDIQADFSIRGATFGQNLILIDGHRLNDSQTGHHNGDVPVTLAGIERIEIVTGPGSATHGADALGGTINIITRSDRHAAATLMAGQHGYAAAQVSLLGVGLPDWLSASIWGSRSSGFAADRDFLTGGASMTARLARGWTLDVRHVNKSFGADGFYGPSASKEWTNQTVASADWRVVGGDWASEARIVARNHGDHFRWDINRPGFAENRHRTNAVEASELVARGFRGGARLSIGGGGGADWVSSSNLGDRQYAHGFVFAEAQQPLGSRSVLVGGLRFDGYSTFGRAVSPSISAAVQVSPAVRLRASLSRGFRVPTFTERFYHDPANLGTASLVAERGWAADAGVDWTAGPWTVTGSVFGRWDTNVIDWVRAAPTDVWRSTNVRDVTTTGVDVSAATRVRGVSARLYVSALRVDASSLMLLSKYVLEYARYSSGLMLSTPLVAGVHAGVTVDYRNRADGQSYVLVGAKVSRAIGRVEAFVDGTNLFDADYHEIPGVTMPGRWITAGVTIR